MEVPASGAAAAAARRWLNPLVLGLQKMELELTCSVCLKLFCMPTLLPCYHISCRLCVAATESHCACSICRALFCTKDLKPASHIEAVVSIYKSVGSTVSSILTYGECQVEIHDSKAPSGGSCPDSGNRCATQETENEGIYNVAGSLQANVQLCKSLFGQMVDEKFKCDGKVFEIGVERSNSEEKIGMTSVLEQKGPSTSQSSDYQQELGYDNNKQSLKRNLITLDSTVNKMPRYATGASELRINDSEAQQTFQCGFCHSSEITKGSGEMLHYLKGEPVAVNAATQPNVLHVHEKCIEWAPQVYFTGDTAMNLDNELARASKIKCSICGLRGAALGCYSKSCRRSFHVPCAYNVQGCRWDTEKFLMLCPSHSSHKLPCDKRKFKNKIKTQHHLSASDLSAEDVNFPATVEKVDSWTASHPCTKDWVLCGSALSNTDKRVLNDFVNKTGVADTACWLPSVTHVIAATDENGACARTLKVLMGILDGKWILSLEWLKACTKAGKPVPEEPYEITHDVHGSFDGPRTGRLRAMQKAPKLYSGLSFYFSGKFMPNYRSHLEELIMAAGGATLDKIKLSATSVIVYSTEPPQGSDSSSLSEVIKKRKCDAEELAATTGSRVVPHTWLLDSIAACTVQFA